MAAINPQVWTAKVWCDWLGLQCDFPEVGISGVTQDTRKLQAGDAYIALKGENFDGHNFVQQAQDAGAVLALVSELQPVDFPQILVGDTRLALAKLAKMHRESLDLKIVGITGSNGKTTTKELLAFLLADYGKVWATQGNLNNDLGVPLTLLELRAEHRFGVIEMGANHPQEIDFLTRLVQPDIAVITLAAAAHLAGFGSLEKVIETKAEIFRGLKPGGVGVVNADSPGFSLWRNKLGKNLLSFGESSLADAQISKVKSTGVGVVFDLVLADNKYQVELGILGEHNAWNASAALQVGMVFGLDPQELVNKIKDFRNAAGRLQSYILKVDSASSKKSSLIDDSYNANPSSVAAAIKTLAQQDGYKVLCLGQMAELGETSQELHAEVGELAAVAGIDEILCFGDLTQFSLDAFLADGLGRGALLSHQQIVNRLEELFLDKTQLRVLVKGSRSAKMDSVVSQLLERIENVTLA